MSLMLTVQSDFEGRLLASPLFDDVAIIVQRKAITEAEVNNLLRTVKGRSGKIGTCVIVQLPSIDVIDPNLPGPRTALSQSVVVIEHPTLNAGSQGTGKSAEQLAIAALQLFHHFTPFGVTQCFTGGQNSITPDDSIDGLVGYRVTVSTNVALAMPAKVARPTITDGVSDVTLDCGTAGAAIYYTTDGSYPAETNTEATLYTVPFARAAGVLRAAASKADLQQSDVAQLTLS